MKRWKHLPDRRVRARRHQFHRPNFESLENRVQPGSVLLGMSALEPGDASSPDAVAPENAWTTPTTAIRRSVADDDLLPTQPADSLALIPDSVTTSLVPAAGTAGDASTVVALAGSDGFGNSDASLAGMGFAGAMLGAGSSLNSPAFAAAIPAATSAGTVAAGNSGAFGKIVPTARLGMAPAAAPLTPVDAPGQEPAPDGGAANAAPPAPGQQPPLPSLLPVHFEANQGQADGHFQFVARGQGYDMALSAADARFFLGQPTPAGTSAAATAVTVDMQLVGANPSAVAVAQDELPGKVNYMLGSDRSQWHTDIPAYGRVEYQNVYPGVNLVYYVHEQQVEYDFLLAPGADPSAIRLAVTGADQLRVDAAGDLEVQAGGLTVREHKPLVYQPGDGGRQEVPSQFVVQGQQVSFQVGSYDASRPLVIDPLIFYQWIGGPGTDGANDVKVDAAGNMYVTGFYQDVIANATYAFVVKINPAGGNVYTTFVDPFIVNPGDFVTGRGLAIDAAGDAFVSGSASSPAFGVAQVGLAFALNAAGAGAYAYTTNGPGVENLVGAWADAGGNAYYTGWVVDPFTGFFDILAAKIAPNGAVVYAATIFSLAGGNAIGLGVAADGAGDANISGQIFNGVTNVGYVAQLNPAGNAFNWQAGYGIPSQNGGVTVDGAGNVYVAGQKLGGPTGQHSLLLLKLNPLGGLTYVWLWRVGATLSPIFPRIAVDVAGNAYVSDTLVHHRRGTFGWVGKFGPNGNVLLGRGVLSNGGGLDGATGVALNNLAVPDVYVSGFTNRTLFGGATDGFVAVFR